MLTAQDRQWITSKILHTLNLLVYLRMTLNDISALAMF